jgi:phosphoribosylaminoimidazole carboxylase
MPLGSTQLKVGAAAMLNIVGKGSDEAAIRETFAPCQRALEMSGATVHMYGKGDVRAGRKMGHITVVGDTLQQVTEKIEKLAQEDLKGKTPPLVGIIMGSDSDLPIMKDAAEIFKKFDVPYELSIVSAHRTPERMMTYAKEARERGIRIIIAGAGGAAHLPGMVAAITPLPVIGVPVALKYLDGMDSLYSIVQMPRGVPVATVAINNSTNAGLLAVRMLGAFIPEYLDKMVAYQSQMETEVLQKVEKIERGWESYK